MKEAFKSYKDEVSKGIFPGEENMFSIDDEVIQKLY